MAGTGGYALWLLLLRNVRGQENCWWMLKVLVHAKHVTEGATYNLIEMIGIFGKSCQFV